MGRLLMALAVAALCLLPSTQITQASPDLTLGDVPVTWYADSASVAYLSSSRTLGGLHVIDVVAHLGRFYDDVKTATATDETVFSPDRKWVAAIVATGAPPAKPALVVQRLDGSDRHVLSDTDYFPIAWSPDSRQLAFNRSWSGSGLPPLYTIGIDGSDLTKLSDAARFPAWSPDGTKIAYSQLTSGQRADVVVANTDGSQPRAFAAFGDSHTEPTWSPDGSRIAAVAFANSSRNIDVIDVVNGSPRRFPLPLNQTAFRLSWAPDSQHLIVSATVSNTQDRPPSVYQIDLQSGRLDAILPEGGEASYSPDGTKIAYAARGDCASTGIYVADASGGASARMTNDCHQTQPPPRVSVTPQIVTYGETVTIRGWFPPDAATPLVRVVDFGTGSCEPTSEPKKSFVESVAGNWSYRFRPCKNGGLNIYSDTSLVGATVGVKPILQLRRIGTHEFNAIAVAGAPLGGSHAILERRSGLQWKRVRVLTLINRSTRASAFVAGRSFAFRPSSSARVRVEMPMPIVNGTSYGLYAPATSNVVEA